MECAFCKILEGLLPSWLVYEDERDRVTRAQKATRPTICISSALALVVAACNSGPGAGNPVAPGQTSVAPPTVSVRTSGVVFEHTLTGFRPLGGVPMRVTTFAGDRKVSVDTVSFSDGAYEVHGTVVPNFVMVQVRPEFPHRAPCTAHSWSNGPLDVHVVSETLLSTTGAPRSVPTTGYTVSGLVTERTAAGVRPIVGAVVALLEDRRTFVHFDSDPLGDTLTDAEGAVLDVLGGPH